MRNYILIVRKKCQNKIQDFLKSNQITECFETHGNSSKVNFLKELLNLYSNQLVVYMFKAKTSQSAVLEKFLKSSPKYRSSILLGLKKEYEMEKIEKENVTDYARLVVAIVPAGFNEIVVDCVKEIGESGATILSGKGMGKNYSSFMGIELENEKDIVLVATKKSRSNKFANLVRKRAIEKNVQGLVFTIPLEDYKTFKKR